MTDIPGMTDHPLILIDGECLLCNRFARFVIRHDPAGIFRFAALNSPVAVREMESRGLPPPSQGTFVLVTGDKAFFRSEAAWRVLDQLAPPWKFAGWLRLIPLGLRDPAYALVARYRYRLLGRIDACGILSPAEKNRFLNDGAN